jgi:hypothetical protein
MYVTSNLHFQEVSYIHTHLMTYCDSHDDLLSAMAFRMKLKYEKYWGDVHKINRLLFVGAILDPRYKIVTLEFWFKKIMGVEEGEKFIEILKVDVERLYKHYSDGLSSDGPRMGSEICDDYDYDSQSSGTTVGRERRSSNPLCILQEFHQSRASRNLLDCKSELERYYLEDVESPSSVFDILTWWKVNSTKFPIIARIARDVLAIPITTVASESAFSTGGRVLDPYRSSLAPKTVEALICAQNWLRSSPISPAQRVLEAVEDFESFRLDSGNNVL